MQNSSICKHLPGEINPQRKVLWLPPLPPPSREAQHRGRRAGSTKELSVTHLGYLTRQWSTSSGRPCLLEDREATAKPMLIWVPLGLQERLTPIAIGGGHGAVPLQAFFLLETNKHKLVLQNSEPCKTTFNLQMEAQSSGLSPTQVCPSMAHDTHCYLTNNPHCDGKLPVWISSSRNKQVQLRSPGTWVISMDRPTRQSSTPKLICRWGQSPWVPVWCMYTCVRACVGTPLTLKGCLLSIWLGAYSKTSKDSPKIRIFQRLPTEEEVRVKKGIFKSQIFH